MSKEESGTRPPPLSHDRMIVSATESNAVRHHLSHRSLRTLRRSNLIKIDLARNHFPL